MICRAPSVVRMIRTLLWSLCMRLSHERYGEEKKVRTPA